jgi:hypothetical protein
VGEGHAVRYALVILAACSSAQHAQPHQERLGAIAGLVRDHDSGDVISQAKIHIRPQGQILPLVTISAKDGTYTQPKLAPGHYSLSADFGTEQVNVENIVVGAGDPTVVDITFTLGHPDPVTVDFGNPKDSEIDRYRPAHHPSSGLIEGTVNDRGSHMRVAGAVVTAIGPGAGPLVPTLQAVSDDQGRYRFDPVPPGIYIVSAYYSVGDRGQIEVRRSGIAVEPSEGVIVPLWVETER